MAASKGVEFGLLYRKCFKKEKTEALKRQAGNFHAPIVISDQAYSCLRWWIDNLDEQVKLITHGDTDVFLHMDASLKGGVHMLIVV